MTIKTHKFNGRLYAIDFDDCVGICQPPDNSLPTIYFPHGLDSSRKSLEIVIHEAIHACYFDMPEDRVDILARDLSIFLWKLKYRKG